MKYYDLVLKKGREESLQRFHPWIFSGGIKSMDPEIVEGSLVRVLSSSKEVVAYGYYQIGSIAVKILTFGDKPITYQVIKSKVESAWKLRLNMGLVDSKDTNVFRFIFAEGDLLPGLIADYYNGTIVIQIYSVGIYNLKEMIQEAMVDALGDRLKAIYNKSSSTLPFKAGIDHQDGFTYGEYCGNEVIENGYKLLADWEQGQKTGFFVDQRENRKLLAQYSKGRDVLNMFCYTGGFSFFAMAGDAKTVTSVDISKRAIELTDKNIELNFKGDPRHSSHVADAFDFLKDNGEKYDLIVLDPPAFSKNRSSLKKALIGYRRLNKIAFSKIKPGGIIFTFSCSQSVDKNSFRNALFTAAAQANREVRILEQLSQPSDHPINIYHPEGEYLKGLILYVE